MPDVDGTIVEVPTVAMELAPCGTCCVGGSAGRYGIVGFALPIWVGGTGVLGEPGFVGG